MGHTKMRRISLAISLIATAATLTGVIAFTALGEGGLGRMSMGPSMMGGGTMMGPATGDGGQPSSRDEPGNRLLGYVRSEGLSCMGCHALSRTVTAPAFADIARRYRGQARARARLARSIADGVSGKWAGYPPMPGGLASPEQADALAALILDLRK